MTRDEKQRRRDISRRYKQQAALDASLHEHPVCDGTWFLCDTCSRLNRGCGLHPFEPRVVDMPGATDPIECEGYC